MLFLLACMQDPYGLRATPEGNGPMVVVDYDAKPLPQLPFPNDLATRTDPTSPTGFRLNIATDARTHAETEAREKANTMTGFGVYAPITVSFTERLDLDVLLDRHRDNDNFFDDAIYVVNVDPESEGYLELVRLDVGHGRFPVDVPDTGRYFENDARADSPSLLFETFDEDLNGNGVLDWGEDTDNDGRLDKPNVWPEGGDPRADLMGFYELESETLILRPVVPLREETTYAVVLTERLVGTDGEPVKSPWTWVNHTRQTDAIFPAMNALPDYGVDVEGVAFAWSFTTGRITGELQDVRNGLHGEGPFSWLGDAYPATMTDAAVMHTLDSDDPHRLPIDVLMTPLVSLGLFDGAAADFLVAGYENYGDAWVGGAFYTPYLLADRDDGGFDDSDEMWEVDTHSGSLYAAPQRVPFTCALPSVGEPPYDVVIFGHGYGSSRFDFLGFAHAFNRTGKAACAIDFPGHGPTVDPDELETIEVVLDGYGLQPVLDHLWDARFRDLDNNGTLDSGGDQWSADTFHTRDMVRQAALDWSQFVRMLDNCGEGTMVLEDGSERVTCDWDDDGEPDIGTPDARYYYVGGSLGGYNASVAAAIEPRVTATGAIVAGGGVLDNGVRTEISGAVEALLGRLFTPIFMGTPTKDGGLDIVQMVNSVTDMRYVTVATLDSVPSGGRVVVENLDNGELVEGWIPEDGTFRVGIAADATDAYEKRMLTGMPHTGADEGEVYTAQDTTDFGDELIVTLYDANDALVAEIDTFEVDAVFESVTYPAGEPLVALADGNGYIRGTSDLRRVASFFASVFEPGDPIAYAPTYGLRPPEARGGEPINMLLMPTPGDTIVSINAQYALARAAGLIDFEHVDPRWNKTMDRHIIDSGAVHGLEEFQDWTCADGEPCLFDIDDLDEGLDQIGAPSAEPVRAEYTTDAGTIGMRVPYADKNGSHGFSLPDPDLPFDINTFAIFQIADYFARDGAEISDDHCLEDASCASLDWVSE